MSVLRYLKHAPLLLLSIGCAEPGSGAIAKGNRAALEGRYDDAAVSYQQACTEAPKLARAHALLGNAHWAAGRSVEAQAAWTKAVELDPAQVDAAIGLSGSARLTGDATAAIDRLAAALAKDPARPELLTARALALIRRNGEGDLARADKDSETATRTAPKDPDVLYTRGSVLIAAHRFNDAQSTLDALARVAPSSALGPYGLARLAAAQSRKTDVMLHLRSARTAAGATWQPAMVAADPAFAFLKEDPDFVREVSGR